jgi:hypothetical protein
MMQDEHLKLNPGLSRQKQHSTKEDSFRQLVEIKFEEEIVKYCIWSLVLSGAETGTPWKVDQKYLENFEMWCWRRMEKINWSDRVRKEEVLYTAKERSTQRK